MDNRGIRSEETAEILLKTTRKSKATSRLSRWKKEAIESKARVEFSVARQGQTRRILRLTRTQYLLKEMLTDWRLLGGS